MRWQGPRGVGYRGGTWENAVHQLTHLPPRPISCQGDILTLPVLSVVGVELRAVKRSSAPCLVLLEHGQWISSHGSMCSHTESTRAQEGESLSRPFPSPVLALRNTRKVPATI